MVIQQKVQNRRNTFETLLWYCFTWVIILNSLKNVKTRKNLRALYNGLWKPDLDVQKELGGLVSFKTGVI